MLHEAQGKVAINSTIDLSTFVPHKADASGEALQPTISHIKIEVNATMLPGNPTLVASIDDPAMERKFDVEALVTKVE